MNFQELIISIVTMTTEINKAMNKVVMLYLENESKDFRENVGDEVVNNFDLFCENVKKHIFYSLIVLNYQGDECEIKKWSEEYFKEHFVVVKPKNIRKILKKLK